MKKSFLSTSFAISSFVVGFIGTASTGAAQVEYVRICSLYGAEFHYVPGTDFCRNEVTGDTRQQTDGGVWRSLLPYPEGHWVTLPQLECSPGGRLVQIGVFKSTDFTLNAYTKKQTAPISLPLKTTQFISKVMMSGGFYDPRVPNDRHGVNGAEPGLCLRSIDPNVLENQGNTVLNPPYGNGFLPIGCIANSRILNMPASYSIAATSAYPEIDNYVINGDTPVIAGPYTYGTQLVVTTDIGKNGPLLLTYLDNVSQTSKPLAGTLTVSVCVEGN